LKVSLIIPARYESSRFPGKPLAMIQGIAMLERTYKQCCKALDNKFIYIATDDERIEEFCKQKNIKTILTSKNCLTGTDRVAEAARSLDFDIFINVQGDEPIFNPDDISILLKKSLKYQSSVICGYAEIKTSEQYGSNQIPKVIFDKENNLLYMSRSPIPGNKNNQLKKAYRQVCAYSFPKDKLEIFGKEKKKSFFEEIEDLEILRFLEHGIPVKMLEMSDKSISVDNPEDIIEVDKYLNE